MKVSIKIDGLDDLLADLRKVQEVSDEALVDTINDVALDTQSNAIQGIQRGPASGRTYKRGTTIHRASAPGQYPMSDTGRLASNVKVELANQSNIVARVGTGIAYGPWLEFGTSKMAARPWLLPSYKKAIVDVAEEIKAKVEALK